MSSSQKRLVFWTHQPLPGRSQTREYTISSLPSDATLVAVSLLIDHDVSLAVPVKTVKARFLPKHAKRHALTSPLHPVRFGGVSVA